MCGSERSYKMVERGMSIKAILGENPSFTSHQCEFNYRAAGQGFEPMPNAELTMAPAAKLTAHLC